MFLPKETFGRKAGVIDEMVHNCKPWPQQQHHFHLISGYIKKKSNYITVPESQDRKRANTHSFCVLTETILCVKIMPSKNSNNLIIFPIKCYYFTKNPFNIMILQ